MNYYIVSQFQLNPKLDVLVKREQPIHVYKILHIKYQCRSSRAILDK